MNPERWQQLKRLFEEALEKDAPARASRLAAASPTPEPPSPTPAYRYPSGPNPIQPPL